MVRKSALVIGTHPIVDDVVRQYEDRSFHIIQSEGDLSDGDSVDEIFIATETHQEDRVADDLRNVSLARRLCVYSTTGRPIRCHILLHSPQVFQMFKNDTLSADFGEHVEVFPFTEESLWAQRIFTLLPGQDSDFPFVHRIPKTAESEKIVHIVLLGLNYMTEELVEYAALTCHYPNYLRDHSLRTRITIVDDNMSETMYGFIHRHKSLMDNSFYRLVDLKVTQGACVREFHVPERNATQEDWVDVEWEFVNGGLWSEVLQGKLRTWAADGSQFLSVVLGYGSEDSNFAAALELPGELMAADVPVLIRLSSAELVGPGPWRKGLIPFGMKNFSYDIEQPLSCMAQMVNYVYQCCYEDNYLKDDNKTDVFSPVAIDMAVAKSLWRELPYSKKLSNVYNAMTIPVKMKSLGYELADWSVYYAISAKGIAMLAEIEHNRWNISTLLLGYRPVTEEQEKEIENDISLKKEYRNKRIHYDLRAYGDLRTDASGRNANTYDRCLAAAIPLIAKTYITIVSDGWYHLHTW